MNPISIKVHYILHAVGLLCGTKVTILMPMSKPAVKRIQYKILLLTYKCLRARVPSYLSGLLTCRKNLSKLRSSAKGPFLEQPTSRSHTAGDRAFSVAAPQLWNELPFELQTCKNGQNIQRTSQIPPQNCHIWA